MGYYLHAFLGRPEGLTKIDRKYGASEIVGLTHDVALIPMTEQLFDQINGYRDNSMGKWEFLTRDVEEEILALVGDDMIAYIEVEYFGGEGGQNGIVWENGERIFEREFGQEVVNEILQRFGVVRDKSKRDEFDTLGLGRYRNTRDWIATRD